MPSLSGSFPSSALSAGIGLVILPSLLATFPNAPFPPLVTPHDDQGYPQNPYIPPIPYIPFPLFPYLPWPSILPPPPFSLPPFSRPPPTLSQSLSKRTRVSGTQEHSPQADTGPRTKFSLFAAAAAFLIDASASEAEKRSFSVHGSCAGLGVC